MKQTSSHRADPLQVFRQLCGGEFNTCFLLESADLTTKRSIQSLIGIDIAAVLTIRGQRAQLEANNANGQALVDWVRTEMAEYVKGDGFEFERLCTNSDEEARLRSPSPLDLLRKMVTRIPIVGGGELLAAGYFSYDLIDLYEDLPSWSRDELEAPDAMFLIPETLAVIHHHDQSLDIKAFLFEPAHRDRLTNRIADLKRQIEATDDRPYQPPMATPSDFEVDWSDDDFAAKVEDLKSHIVAGDVFQIVPSRTFKVPCPDPCEAYARLRTLNPSPYMFYINDGDRTVFGASPETAVRVDMPDRMISIRPIAGTAPRGRRPDGSIDDDLDNRLQAELVRHEKELAEHMMLIDLARNDVARVTEAGSRQTSEILTVEKYAYVMHLVSNVTGRLRRDLDALHAYMASMNMGTLVGAPKVMAAKILRQTEPTKRGPYGGAVGFLTSDGTMNTAIIIRSAVVRDDTAHVRAGAGVVFDSVPASEAIETRRKAQAVLTALGVKP